MTEVWTQWEGRSVNGIYPLRRFLNSSDHSAVFLTESTTEGFLNAAIKLVPASPELIAVQLWHWKTAATFTHPHLIRLLDWGQCEIDGRAFLFVVMEYAEENLSQILPVRALGPDEARELLVPTLDALAFLHRENWVQGQLKPSNFLVVNDHLKLAADTIRPSGVSREPAPRPTMYDSPEAQRGDVSAAADVWALGVTLVEALTQYPPTWLNGPTEPPSLPTNLPTTFADIVQRCLSVDPAGRPTVTELQEQTKPASSGGRPPPPPQIDPAPRTRQPAAPTFQSAGAQLATAQPAGALSAGALPAEEVVWATPPPGYSTEREPPKRSLVTPAIAAVVVVLVAVWGGNHFLRKNAAPAEQAPAESSSVAPTATPDAVSEPELRTQQPPPPSTAPQSAASQSAAAPPAPPPPPRTASNATRERPAPMDPRQQRPADASASAVVHEEIPNVPQSARHTIQGHVKVAVRVTVDSSGKVVRDSLDVPGPSRYFSRLASQAARKWKFAAADTESSREWLLRFEFGRDGTTVHATRSRS